MRRLLILLAVATCCASATGCSDVQPRACESARDCFGGELCRDGTCVVGIVVGSDVGAPGDASRLPDVDASAPSDCRLGSVGACEGRVCNVSTGACEPCQRDVQCGPGGLCDKNRGLCACEPGFHDCDGVCVPDDAATSCGTRCEPCPGAFGGEPVCSNDACAIECTPPYLPCEAGCDATAPCVECLSNTDCKGPDAARCDKGFCTRCQSDADCGHLDVGVCFEGACVECTTAKRAACGNNSCNPATGECTDTAVGTLQWCQRCVADSECEPNHRCIQMNYGGAPRPDGYCLVEADGECLYVDPIIVQRDSLSGVVGEFYCVIREDLTTCEAVRDFKSPCDQDDDCGVDGLADGRCRFVDGERVCTYPCATTVECANGTTCVGNPPDNSYCHR